MLGHVEYNGRTKKYRATMIDDDQQVHEAEADTLAEAHAAVFEAAVGERIVVVRNINEQQ